MTVAAYPTAPEIGELLGGALRIRRASQSLPSPQATGPDDSLQFDQVLIDVHHPDGQFTGQIKIVHRLVPHSSADPNQQSRLRCIPSYLYIGLTFSRPDT